MLNLDTGYPHDGRADKRRYRHDRRAQFLFNKTCHKGINEITHVIGKLSLLI